MATDYCRGVLRVCVAQLCQNLGWHNTQSTPLELLTNVLERYLLELGKVSHRYSEQFGRTEPNLDDLALTFRHVGIQLGELEEYIRHIEPVAFSQDTIAFPVPKQNNLQFPNSRSREIQQHREEHINGHLPYMYPGLEEEVEEETPPASLPVPNIPSDALSPLTISPSSAEKRAWSGSADGSLTKRSRLSASALPEEAGPSQYEMMSVVMTQNGVLTPTRQGKLPDARTPPPGFRQAIQFYKENRKEEEKSDKKDRQDKSGDSDRQTDRKDNIDKSQKLFLTADKQLDRLGRPTGKLEKSLDRGDKHVKSEKGDSLSDRSDTLKENIRSDKSSHGEMGDIDVFSSKNVHPKKQMLTKHLKKVAAAAEHADKQGSPKSAKSPRVGKNKSPRASSGSFKVKKTKDKGKSSAAHDRESWLKDFFPSKPEESKDKASTPVVPPSMPTSQVNPLTSPSGQTPISVSQMKDTLKESKKLKLFDKGSKGVPKTKIIVVHPKTAISSDVAKISFGLDEDSGNSCEHSPERLVIAEGDVRTKESQKSRKARLAGIDESIDSVIRNCSAEAEKEMLSPAEVKVKVEEFPKIPEVIKKKDKVKLKITEKIKKKDKVYSGVKSYSSSDSIFASIDSVIRQSSEETDIPDPPKPVKEEIVSPLRTQPEVVPEREPPVPLSLLPLPAQLKIPKRSPGRPRKKPRGKAAAKAKDEITRDILKTQIQKKSLPEQHEIEVKVEKIVSPEISVYDFPESPGPPETKKVLLTSPKSSSSVKSPLPESVFTSVIASPAVVAPPTSVHDTSSNSHVIVEKEKKTKKDKDRKERKDKDRTKDKEHRKEKKEKRRDKEKKKKNKDKDRERSKDKDRMKDEKFKDTFEALPGFVPKIKLNIKLGSAPSSSVAVSVSERKIMSPQHEVSVAGSSGPASLIKPSRPEIPKLVIKPIRCESLDIRSPEPAPSPVVKSPPKMKSPARAKSPVKTRSPSRSPSPSPSRSPSPPPLKVFTPPRSPSPPQLDAQITPPPSKVTSQHRSPTPSPPPRSPSPPLRSPSPPPRSPSPLQRSPSPPPRSPSPPPRSPSPSPAVSPSPSTPHRSPTPSPKLHSPPSPPSRTPSPEPVPSPSPPPSEHHSPTPPPRTPSPSKHPHTPTPPPKSPSSPPRTPSPIPRTPSPWSSSPVRHSPSQSPSKNKSTPSPSKSSRSSPKSSPIISSPPTPREAAKRAAEKVAASRSPATSKGSPGDMSRAVIVETVGTFVDASGQQIWICPACKMPDDGSPMIGCDGCDDWYHWPCVDITEEPPKEQDWFCPRCAAKIKAKGVKGRGRGKGRGRKKKV